jgi:hypothetical protein
LVVGWTIYYGDVPIRRAFQGIQATFFASEEDTAGDNEVAAGEEVGRLNLPSIEEQLEGLPRAEQFLDSNEQENDQ